MIEGHGPLLVFGGPYSNLQATEAIRKVAESKGILPSHIVCTGDAIAYCAQPNETVNLLKAWGIHWIKGNCEQALANNADDCGCGFDEGSPCDVLSNRWFGFSQQALSADNKQHLSTLPDQLLFSYQGQKIQVFHGSPKSQNQFLFASTDDSVFSESMTHHDADLLIGGHSGLPFVKAIGQAAWLNAGAIGMPANDGTARTWYAIVEISPDDIYIALHPLEYDIASCVNAMQAAGLNNAYCTTLNTGLWPSLDVLPKVECQATGHGLAPIEYRHTQARAAL